MPQSILLRLLFGAIALAGSGLIIWGIYLFIRHETAGVFLVPLGLALIWIGIQSIADHCQKH